MVEAYVLVKMAAHRESYGFARTVLDSLSSIEGVENAHLLFGDYDALVKLKDNKIHDIENLIIENISLIDGVESTSTLLCIDESILE